MKRIYTVLIFIISIFQSSALLAQTEETESTDSLSGVVIHADPRLDVLMASNTKVKKTSAVTPGKTAKVIRSGRGFRIQIYVGNDRSTAISKKVNFMQLHPNIKTYMTYTQPQYRVKVGDFSTRKEAYAFMSQIKNVYPASMIVPDYIVINTFKKQ